MNGPQSNQKICWLQSAASHFLSTSETSQRVKQASAVSEAGKEKKRIQADAANVMAPNILNNPSKRNLKLHTSRKKKTSDRPLTIH